MAIHSFEDALAKFDELVGELDSNIRGEVLEEIAERAQMAIGDEARGRVALALGDEIDEDDLDEDEENDDDFDDDDDDDVDDDEEKPS